MKTFATLTLIFSTIIGAAANAAIVDDNCKNPQNEQIQAAIDARLTDGSKKMNVVLPPGCIGIVKPIYLLDWITLRGPGKRLTTLKALPGFTGSALVIIGTGLASDIAEHRFVFDSMVADMTLDVVLAPTGTSCAYLGGAQEGSGLERILCGGLTGANTDGIRVAVNVNRAAFREIEVYPEAPIRYGISIESAICGCEISNVTLGVQNTMQAGIRILDGTFSMNRIHCEYAANCIQIDGNNSQGIINSVDGPSATSTNGNLLFVAGDSMIVAQSMVKNGYSNNVLSMVAPGVNLADPVIGQVLINNNKYHR